LHLLGWLSDVSLRGLGWLLHVVYKPLADHWNTLHSPPHVLAAALYAAEVDAGAEHEQADDASNTAACLLARVAVVWSAVVS